MARRKYNKYSTTIFKSDYTYVKNNIIAHCMYHNMFNYCDENLIRQAYDNVKKKHIEPIFYTVLSEMENLIA